MTMILSFMKYHVFESQFNVSWIKKIRYQFWIMIIRTWFDMSCFCLAAWCYFRITMNFLQAHETWCYSRITNMSHSKYVRYELNYFICSHKNEIMRSLQLLWKILRKLSNWNQKKSQTSDFYTACHEKSCKCYNNILMSILQKNSYDQVVLCLCY